MPRLLRATSAGKPWRRTTIRRARGVREPVQRHQWPPREQGRAPPRQVTGRTTLQMQKARSPTTMYIVCTFGGSAGAAINVPWRAGSRCLPANRSDHQAAARHTLRTHTHDSRQCGAKTNTRARRRKRTRAKLGVARWLLALLAWRTSARCDSLVGARGLANNRLRRALCGGRRRHGGRPGRCRRGRTASARLGSVPAARQDRHRLRSANGRLTEATQNDTRA